MGNCSQSDSSEELFKQYSKAEIKAHFIATIKLGHFNQRKQLLIHEADKNVEQIREQVFKKITTKKEQVLEEFKEEIRKIKENQEEFNKINKKRQSIQDFVGLSTVQSSFNYYEKRSTEKFNQIKKQMIDNNNAIFNRIQSNLEQDLIQFEETEKLTKFHINNFFEKMKIVYREEVKRAELQIENQFKDQLTPDYYGKKLKAVVSPEELREIAKMKPTTFNFEPIIEPPTMPEPRGWCFC